MAETASLDPQAPVSRKRRLQNALNKRTVNDLTADLDASDRLECYFLTRTNHVRLKNVTIPISTAALGLRQRVASSNSKNQLSITLEFGPPREVVDDKTYLKLPSFTETDIFWQMTGGVYYGDNIAGNGAATYLASVSGVAARRLLMTALEYPKRYYQPFALQSESELSPRIEHWKELQSDDTAFVLYLYQHLATLGVILQPVLPPPHTETRLHIAGWRKAGNGISVKFQALQDCVTSLATGQYGVYETSAPTMEESSLPTMLNATAPTSSPADMRRRLDELAASTPPVTLSPTISPAPTTLPPTSSPTVLAGYVPATDDASRFAENLKSNQGALIASTLQECFHNPLYDIRIPGNDTVSFPMRYGGHWIEFDLVPPYMSVVPRAVTLPHPREYSTVPTDQSKAWVDYFLAMTIGIMFGVGVLLVILQMAGGYGGVRWLRPFYRWQKRLFDPLSQEEDETDTPGSDFMFSEDVIPLSMGGQPSSAVRAILQLSNHSAASSSEGEIELNTLNGSDHGSMSVVFRDPDLVDMPDTSSRSKVAVPVAMSPQSR